ncbi:MAG: beta-N-acetylglucosaminidase domain-containing protein [Alloprevotella sp.]|nr:beta-N-acetylglucosaminidase domain-containing protein [Alloprevotella sp.]
MKTKILLLLAVLPLVALAQTSNPYGIFPVPHKTATIRTTANITENVNIVAEDGIDSYTRQRAVQILEEHGKTAAFVEEGVAGQTTLRLGVYGSGGKVDALAPRMDGKNALFALTKYDRHYISIQREADGDAADILIVGENTDATFCGLASIEQILDRDAKGVTCGTIEDYADIKDRGVIEGYYGVPYSAEVTKDLFRFMARYKMNMYMYGAKSDPYHSQYWGDPYPTSITEQQRQLGYLSQSMLREITDVAHQCKVNFIWAIHPGTAFTNSGNTTVVSTIMSKFESMYKLGVRQFGVFVDDVGVPTDDATLKLNADRLTDLQNRIDKKWNVEGAAPADTVKPLNFVPQLYALSWASVENCRKFYGALSSTPSKVNIYITGNAVWTVPNSSDLATAKSYLGREVSWWWNYPCNDNDVTKLFPMDTYSNFSDETHISGSARLEENLVGAKTLISNPMQQGEVSKIALFSIADYSWNNAAFDNKTSWEASFAGILGEEYGPSLRTLAPYLRYYDSNAFNSLATKFKTALTNGGSLPEDMSAEMQKLLSACAKLHGLETSERESDRLFYDDVKPWLLKVEAMAQEVENLIRVAAMPNDDDEKWETYVSETNNVAALSTDERFTFNILSGLGSGISLSVRRAQPAQQVMAPFVEWLRDNALGKGYFTNAEATRPVFVGSREDMKGSGAQRATGDAYVSSTGVVQMQPGDYVGIEMPKATKLVKLTVADTIWDKYEVLRSADGKRWFTMQAGELPEEHVKYVVFRNAGSDVRTLKVDRDVLCLTVPMRLKPASATTPQCDEGYYESHTANLMMDGNYDTYTCIKRNQQTGDAYMLTLSEPTTIHDVRICMGTTNDDYMTAGRVQVSEDGTQWKNLPIMGTTTTSYSLSHKNNVRYSDNMTYCDFDGKEFTAKYVRLYVSSPNTSKWLRLYEIEVNGRYLEKCFQGRAVDSKGNTIASLTDAMGYTAYEPASMTAKGEFVYHLRSQSLANAVTIYRGGDATTDAVVSVTLDGEHWTELGGLDGYVCRISLADYPAAVALRVSWTKAAPLIYEITEETDGERKAVVTDIVPVAGQLSSNDLQVRDGRLWLKAAEGVERVSVYTPDGRLLLSFHAAGAGGEQLLPVDANAGGTLIVRTAYADGRHTANKLLLRR